MGDLRFYRKGKTHYSSGTHTSSYSVRWARTFFIFGTVITSSRPPLDIRSCLGLRTRDPIGRRCISNSTCTVTKTDSTRIAIAIGLTTLLHDRIQNDNYQICVTSVGTHVRHQGYFCCPSMVIAYSRHSHDGSACGYFPGLVVRILSSSARTFSQKSGFVRCRALRALSRCMLVGAQRRQIRYFRHGRIKL